MSNVTVNFNFNDGTQCTEYDDFFNLLKQGEQIQYLIIQGNPYFYRVSFNNFGDLGTVAGMVNSIVYLEVEIEIMD